MDALNSATTSDAATSGAPAGVAPSGVAAAAAPAWHAAYHAVREEAALFSRPEASLVVLTGAERGSYLDTLSTNKVVDLAPGQGTRAFFLNPTKGRVLADFLACETRDTLWLECQGGSASTVMEILRKYYFGQDVEFVDLAGKWRAFSLQGPASASFLERTGAGLPPDEPGAHAEAAIGAHAVRILRWSDTGETGFHLWVPAHAADSIEAAIVEAGAVPGREEAWTVLQIEAGVAAYGCELTDEIIPLEAPTENAISHTKGCYPGQEVIARLHVRGRPAKHLRGLKIEVGEPLPAGTVLDAADKAAVGRVTRSGVSPVLGAIALAYVHKDYCEVGTRLAAQDGSTAVIVDLPMVPVRA